MNAPSAKNSVVLTKNIATKSALLLVNLVKVAKSAARQVITDAVIVVFV